MDEAAISRIAAWLCCVLAARAVRLSDWCRLTGGAIQQNWAVSVAVEGGDWAGEHAWVLRRDSAGKLDVSRPRAEEFALLKAAAQAGVTVPRPLFLCADDSVIGGPFFLMARIEGVTQAHRIVRSETLGGGRTPLAAALGRELARLHSIRPPRDDLAFLGGVPTAPAADRAIASLRAALDRQPTARPILEWGLRHLERRAPPPGDVVLCHNDFRTGNFMVDEAGISGVLDWEFAACGDPHEDIGWLCAPCWRFGNDAMTVGGIGPFAPFAAAYEAEAGRRIDPAQVAWWALLATIRWAVIATSQAQRHLSGAEASLELALTGHVVPELELDVMRMVREQAYE
ncbi:MAG TPA: phosphotransferase family protein [Acetobacteraceae bacterium]|jgi:aminoglycoside phosphotransferase (APT) family kinase protein